MRTMVRRAGVVIPLFSIRAGGRDWGLGEIPDLARFAEWAARAGLRVVQILPVNEPAGGQASPYAARTAFGIDPTYIALDDVEDFHAAGGVAALTPGSRARLEAARASASVRWEDLRAVKAEALHRAFVHFAANEHGTARSAALEAYAEEESDWLEEYALFAAIHAEHGSTGWLDWPAPLRDRHPPALAEARTRLRDRIAEQRYIQWLADVQWRAARKDAEAHGVELMGDLPFLVAGDSADIWSRAEEFRLDLSVGVPPDAFSEEGQDWGLPVFRWDVIAHGGFAWMRARGRRAAELYGLFRVDHVVGLYRTFYRLGQKPVAVGPGKFTPDTEPEQIRLGEHLLQLLDGRHEGGGRRVIAEDLGTVPDFVRASLDRLGIPGYRVLRWEKDGAVFRDPAAWPALSIATTGTHDTESLAEWYDGLKAAERRALLAIVPTSAPHFNDAVRDAILECVYRSGSDLVLVPFQDFFGARERINVPGTVSADNWTYRMPVELGAVGGTTGLAALAERAGRRRT
jgi:4-alpha-glucanotransferase